MIAIGKRTYTAAKAEANARFNAKTYKQVNFRLRKDTDIDIIESIEAAQKKGINNREWLRELFEGKK